MDSPQIKHCFEKKLKRWRSPADEILYLLQEGEAAHQEENKTVCLFMLGRQAFKQGRVVLVGGQGGSGGGGEWSFRKITLHRLCLLSHIRRHL